MKHWKELASKQALAAWRVITRHAREEWRVINEARGAALLAAAIISWILFGVFSFAYQAVMIRKLAATNHQQGIIANLNSTIEDLRAENAELRSKLSVKPVQTIETPKNPPVRDPDGIFQLGSQVGKVTGAKTDGGNSTVFFKNIFSEGKFNPNANFEYRDLVLHVKKLGHSVSGKLLGKKIVQHIDVECLIVRRSSDAR
jgi:hypothetical protein